jgi:hypothetical protein
MAVGIQSTSWHGGEGRKGREGLHHNSIRQGQSAACYQERRVPRGHHVQREAHAEQQEARRWQEQLPRFICPSPTPSVNGAQGRRKRGQAALPASEQNRACWWRGMDLPSLSASAVKAVHLLSARARVSPCSCSSAGPKSTSATCMARGSPAPGRIARLLGREEAY